MTSSPAVIIVVRHGARLDAADKHWHLTSPTPYDPPLTHGGWAQSKSLGARIAGILRTRETDDEYTSGDGTTRKRRHKVVIHSSPFLRCVQTSVAISAGLAQNPGHTHHQPKPAPSPLGKATTAHSSPTMRPSVVVAENPSLAPIPEPAGSDQDGKLSEQPENIRKSTVRVDAFLGEWLSPDYFEHITVPPSSVMMVAGAKADLLRREDYSSLTSVKEAAVASVGFPGGWGSPAVTVAEKKEDEGPLSTFPSLGQSLPKRDRTSSLSSVGSTASRQSHRSASNHAPTAEHGVYQPPIPTYAISATDPIPAGYTAHARDSCVDVDYQWDSMREPQNWGDGGEYGEEWSSMHKRFRKGLTQLVGWYQEHEDPEKLFTKSPNRQNGNREDSAEDEDTDLVVILVTHGAGCNALIGALTNQPVLLDVGMASLTMAVRKPPPPNSPAATPGHSRSSSRVISISDQYDVKLIANTEHLRSTASTPSSSRPPSVANLPAFRESFRERYANNSGSLDGTTFGRSRPVPQSGNFGGIRRTSSIASSNPRNYAPARQTSIGLWSAPQPEEDHVEEEPEDDMILNFGDDATAAKEEKEAKQEEAEVSVEEKKEQEAEQEHEDDDVAPLGGGLWGTPRPPGYAEKIREIAPKRRWTVSERESGRR